MKKSVAGVPALKPASCSSYPWWGQLIYSDDHGRTLGATTLMSPDFQMVFPGTGGVVLASTNSLGLIRSSDHGSTWRQSMFTDGTVTAMARMSDGALLAGVGRGWGCAGVSDTSWGVYRSEDEGLTWAKVGILREQMHSLVSIRQGPYLQGPTRRSIVLPMPERAGRLAGLAQGNVNGLAGTADGWVYAAIAGKGLFRSSNEGASWKGASTMYIGEAVGVTTGANNGIVALGSERGAVIRSTDHGETWVAMNKGLEYDQIHCLTCAGPDQYLCAGNAGGYLWDRVLRSGSCCRRDGLPEAYINGFALGPSGYVYAWTYSACSGPPCS